jgi:hypothetical protein
LNTEDNFRLEERIRHRRRRNVLVLAMSILWCAGATPKFSAQNLNPEEISRSIHGTVVNSVTNEPIGHALVYSPDNQFATMTDDQGHFEFVLSESIFFDPNVHPPRSALFPATRPDQLRARKPGFLADEDVFQSGRVGPEQKEVTLALTPESLIVGQLVLPDDSDRTVVLLYHRAVQEGRARWLPDGNAFAKSNGEFRFAGLKAGKYKLATRELLDRDPSTYDPRGQLYGYPPVYFPPATDFAAPETIDLSAGNTFHLSLSPVRKPYYQVRVPVANVPEGTMLRVIVTAQGRPSPGFFLGYNQQEHRIEGLLPDGNYTLEISNYGSPAMNGIANITVKNAAAQGAPITLVTGGSIVINVKEEFTSRNASATMTWNTNGRSFQVKGPRRYLNLTLWPADDFDLENMASLDPPSGPGDETLLISRAQPGAYWVRVSSNLGFPASITSGGTDLLHHPLILGWGASAPPIEITMRDDWAQLDGKIESASLSLPISPSHTNVGTGQENAESAWIYLVPLPDSAGQFQEFSMTLYEESAGRQIAPGEYRVLVFDRRQPELEYSNPEAMRAYDGKGQVVRFIGGQKEQLTLPLISTSESR